MLCVSYILIKKSIPTLKKVAGHIENGIVLGHKKEGTLTLCYTINGPSIMLSVVSQRKANIM